MNRAQTILETLNDIMLTDDGIVSDDYAPSDDEIIMRMNYRHSTRCPDCGRCLQRIMKLPVIRTCPSGDCGTRFEIDKIKRGLLFRRLHNE